MRIFVAGIFALGLLAAFAASPSPGQSGPLLLVEPWPEGAYVHDRPSLQLWRTHTRDTDESVRFRLLEGATRFRLDPTLDPSPTIGFEAYLLTIRSDDPALPPRLADLSVGSAVLLHRSPNWTLALPFGGGFAGTRPFSDSRAWYGRASLISLHELDEKSQLLLALDYNGNRTLFPDIPLPGAAYVREVNEQLSMTLGVPYSALRWRPDERWQVNVTYRLLTQIDADVQYQLTEDWSLFGAVENQRRAFHRHGDDRHRRLFFQQRRAEAGVRWQVLDRVELLGAGGYSFGGKLERGFDVRNTDTLRRFGDSAYVRIGLSSAF